MPQPLVVRCGKPHERDKQLVVVRQRVSSMRCNFCMRNKGTGEQGTATRCRP